MELRKFIQTTIHEYLNESLDLKVELASIGAELHGGKYSKSRYKPIVATKFNESGEIIPILALAEESTEKNYKNILNQINLHVPVKSQSDFTGEPKKIDAFTLGLLTLKAPQEAQASNELVRWVEDFSQKKTKFSTIKIPKLNRVWFLIAGFGLISLIVFGHYGASIKNQLIVEGNSAVANLENAGENIKNMDFVSASGNFAQAYQEFSKAEDNMNFMGSGISSYWQIYPERDNLNRQKT